MNRLFPDTESSTKQNSTLDSRMGSDTRNKNDVIMDTSPNLPKLNFPAKLHLILSTPEFNDIICWLPHGRAWRVQQQEKLETEILPKFFQHQKSASFYRQVTGWGFHRVVSGTDFNAYYHELFLRDAPDLCRKMKRPTRTELSERKAKLSKVPPDFYVMPPVSEEMKNASVDPTFHFGGIGGDSQISLEEHKDMLIRRLSTYSLTEKGMYLQIELNKLEKKKDDIMVQLKNMGVSTMLNPNSSLGNNSLTFPIQQQQQASAANTSKTNPSNLDLSLFNTLQQAAGGGGGGPSSLTELLQQQQQQQQKQPAPAPPPSSSSLLNNNNLSSLDQLRLELLQQMQTQPTPLLQQQPPQPNPAVPGNLSPLDLAKLLLGGGGLT